MKRLGVIIFALAALLLGGCGGAEPEGPAPSENAAYPTDSTALEIEESGADALCAMSGELPQLKSIVLTQPVSGGDAVEKLRAAFPAAEVSYSVLIEGRALPWDTAELDLGGCESGGLSAMLPQLALLPKLERVTLGAGASLEDVALLEGLDSAPAVDYPVELYGRQLSTANTLIDLDHASITDGGDALRQLLPLMARCTQVNMEYCSLSNEQLAALRDEFPEAGIVWRVSFGCYSARTDETRILASIKGEYLTGAMVSVLKYCTAVKYLDLGHNTINDISFVQYMPDLEVAVLAINYWSDASPLACCTKLEYLEIFNTNCTDLTPLAGLTSLRHLNVSWLHGLKDITPLYGLTGLERLWIGCVHSIPEEQIEEIQRLLPDTLINTTTDAPTFEGWRDDPRYDLLCEQMGYNLPSPYSLG